MQIGVYNVFITKTNGGKPPRKDLKMKKIISLILMLALVCTMVFALASCGETPTAKIGVQDGTTSKMYADVLKGVEVVSFETFAYAAQGMLNGTADYVFVDKTTANALCSQIDGIKIIDIPLSSENYGIGIDPAQTELKAQIDAVLENKAAEIDAIKEKYMNGEESKYVGVTPVDQDPSKADSQLVVATNAEFAPWEYFQNNQYFGIDMEIAQLIADELDMELVISDMKFEMVVGAVGKNGVDIAMSGITITAERLEAINFSNPYYTESIVIVCKDTDTSLDSAGTVVDLLTVLCTPAGAEEE